METTNQNLQLATKSDILRLEEKIDALANAQNQLLARLIVLEQRPRYEQPCEVAKKMMETLINLQTQGCVRLQEHIRQTQEICNDWRRGLVQIIAGLILAVLSGALGYFVSGSVHHSDKAALILKQDKQHQHTPENWQGMP